MFGKKNFWNNNFWKKNNLEKMALEKKTSGKNGLEEMSDHRQHCRNIYIQIYIYNTT